MVQLRPFRPIDASIKHINYQPREEQDMPKMSISRKSKPWPAS